MMKMNQLEIIKNYLKEKIPNFLENQKMNGVRLSK